MMADKKPKDDILAEGGEGASGEEEFNREAIEFYIQEIKQECEKQGDVYAKKILEDFGRQAKQVVADNTKNMTLAYEKEREMLVHLTQKNEQMTKGLQAIEHHQNNF